MTRNTKSLWSESWLQCMAWRAWQAPGSPCVVFWLWQAVPAAPECLAQLHNRNETRRYTWGLQGQDPCGRLCHWPKNCPSLRFSLAPTHRLPRGWCCILQGSLPGDGWHWKWVGSHLSERTHFHSLTCPGFLCTVGVKFLLRWVCFVFLLSKYTSLLGQTVDVLCVVRPSSWSACVELCMALASPGRLSAEGEGWLPVLVLLSLSCLRAQCQGSCLGQTSQPESTEVIFFHWSVLLFQIPHGLYGYNCSSFRADLKGKFSFPPKKRRFLRKGLLWFKAALS